VQPTDLRESIIDIYASVCVLASLPPLYFWCLAHVNASSLQKKEPNFCALCFGDRKSFVCVYFEVIKFVIKLQVLVARDNRAKEGEDEFRKFHRYEKIENFFIFMEIAVWF
jgi:hypothetical protein